MSLSVSSRSLTRSRASRRSQWRRFARPRGGTRWLCLGWGSRWGSSGAGKVFINKRQIVYTVKPRYNGIDIP